MEAGRNVKVEGKDNNLLELIAADPAFNMSTGRSEEVHGSFQICGTCTAPGGELPEECGKSGSGSKQRDSWRESRDQRLKRNTVSQAIQMRKRE